MASLGWKGLRYMEFKDPHFMFQICEMFLLAAHDNNNNVLFILAESWYFSMELTPEVKMSPYRISERRQHELNQNKSIVDLYWEVGRRMALCQMSGH